MNPHLIIAAVVAALGFGGAWTLQDWRYGAKEAERIAAEVAALEASRAKADKAATKHEVDKVRIQTQFVTITETVEKIIEKPIYRADCYDADGMRAHAHATSLTGATSQPSDPMPTAAPVK